ncbi:DsbA family oxidoreductase [Puia sp.]|jgi:predicted DsbA family dithiol-disulfide isomerase|uniref:DsbA family oxidoreductase n=1 Tax=Puia sp. TaxID=2045100 RepID=UPI002F406E7C
MENVTDSIAWHWYDLTCPFCYVSKSRNDILRESGFHLLALPFQAHPDVPAEGIYMGKRNGPLYDVLTKEAEEAGLPLNWPSRLPNSRYALSMAEQVRRHIPGIFPAVKDRLYAAHFTLHEDLGSAEVVNNCLSEFGIDQQDIKRWAGDEQSRKDLATSQHIAQQAGIQGSPAWILHNRLISGLQPRSRFQQLTAHV